MSLYMIGAETIAQSSSENSSPASQECRKSRKIAVLIPCLNEERTIAKVIQDFRRELPEAAIYVYDNNSSDRTALVAGTAGAKVIREKRQGKGFVVASMFEDVEADLYILVDGDDTYPADKVHDLLRPILDEQADMVVGNRLAEFGERSFRRFHLFGNKLVVSLVNLIFKCKLKDIMSGYRAFSRDFVRKVPIVSRGFEVETEMTLQALQYDFVITEVPVPYRKRPEGSSSKLKTFSDGMKTILTVFDIFKAYRPLMFFFIIGAILGCIGLLIGSIPVTEYLETGKIERFPSAILASGIMIVSVICVAIGIILDAINHRLRELIHINVARRLRVEREK
jgi:glycosyltransferase involved in cell wall biosynthesis